MDEVRNLTTEQLEKWLENEEPEFSVESFRRKHDISVDSNLFYITLHRWVTSGKLKRLRRGWYRKPEPIDPILWWNGEEGRAIPLVWPYGVDDGSSFGFNETIEVFPGDTLVLAGRSNQMKTGFALNFMVNNIHLFDGTRLMVNEYKPQRFRARMKKFDWADYWNEDKPKFELLPVSQNHADYIIPDYLNIVDWLHIKENFWDVANQIEQMQMQLRKGILFVVLQKTSKNPLGIGADWGTFLPSVYLTIDPRLPEGREPGKLTVIKVKSQPEGAGRIEGKKFVFYAVDAGSKLHDITEVEDCPRCKGRGYFYDKRCDKCEGRGYIERGLDL